VSNKQADNMWRKRYYRYGRDQFGDRKRVTVYETPPYGRWWWSAGFGPIGPFRDQGVAMQNCEYTLREKEGWKEI
jgi:hypothetical protein